MKQIFPPRPTPPELPHLHEKEYSEFLVAERAWFESVLAHPHVQYVIHIPPDEPIFVLRSQDKHAPKIVREWLVVAEANGGISDDKYNAASSELTAIRVWQNKNPDKVKQPD